MAAPGEDWPQWEDAFTAFAANTRLFFQAPPDCDTDDDELRVSTGCTFAPTPTPTDPDETYVGGGGLATANHGS